MTDAKKIDSEIHNQSTTVSKSGIKTEGLENCVRVINFYVSNDESIIEELIHPDMDYYVTFVNPLKIELNKNLLNRETQEGKRDIISYYIFEFWELQGFFKDKDNEELIFNGTISYNNPVYKAISFTDRAGHSRELKGFEKYVLISHELFDAIFHEIQLCCAKFKIDFFKICDELNFSTDIFDQSASLSFTEMKKKTKSGLVETEDQASLNDFFEQVKEGQITKLEVYNAVQKITDNFQLTKLKILLDDFEFYLFIEKDNKLAEYSNDDIANAINELKEKGREIPYRKIPKLNFKKDEKGILEKPGVTNILDTERLLYPFDFFLCYQFKNFLQTEIKKLEGEQKVPPANIAKDLPVSSVLTFESLLSEAKAAFILKMLEDLSVTENGRNMLTGKRMGALRGIVEALQDKNILPPYPIHKMNKMLARKIGLELKSDLAGSSLVCSDYCGKARKYITDNYKP